MAYTTILLTGVAIMCIHADAQSNTCPQVTQCISGLGNGDRDPAARIEKLRQRMDRMGIDKFGRCATSDLDEYARIATQKKAAQVQRLRRVGECIDGRNNGGQGFNNCPIPQNIIRECRTIRDLFQEARQPRASPARSNNNAERKRQSLKNCRDDSCGCPEAKLCHECYELSDLHDEIHALNRDMLVLRLKCGLGEKGQRNPAKDETMSDAFSN